MRAIVSLAATAVAAFVFGSASAALAQTDPEPQPPAPPAPAPGQPAGPDQPASPEQPALPGSTWTVGSEGATAAPTPVAPAAKDEAQASPKRRKEPEKKKTKLPWHGTTFLVSQYATTQTIGLGSDYLSRDNLYALWLVFDPRYYFYEDDIQAVSVRMRIHADLELTNSDTTTRGRETQLLDTWLLGSYSRLLYEDRAWITRVSTGPRVLFPTSKTSWNAGTRLMLGWSAGAMQGIPLAGKGKPWFPSMGVTGSLAYTKYVNRSTAPESAGFERQVTDTDGRVFVSNVFSPKAMTSHQLMAIIGADFKITDRWGLAAMNYWILGWKYGFSDGAAVHTPTGSAPVGRIEDPQNFAVTTWFYVATDYEVIPQLSIGIGYYNRTNQIGPDGTRRNMLWSPDATVFFDITAHLDEIYSSVAGGEPKGETRGLPKVGLAEERQQARENWLRLRQGLTW